MLKRKPPKFHLFNIWLSDLLIFSPHIRRKKWIFSWQECCLSKKRLKVNSTRMLFVWKARRVQSSPTSLSSQCSFCQMILNPNTHYHSFFCNQMIFKSSILKWSSNLQSSLRILNPNTHYHSFFCNPGSSPSHYDAPTFVSPGWCWCLHFKHNSNCRFF